MIVHMSNSITGWVSKAVQNSLADADRTKVSLSDETGIPYSTLNRKMAGKAEFSMSELLLIAEALGTSPAAFTPPQFQRLAVAA